MPTRLLYYRGGVSEGEFTEVLAKEAKEIRKAFEELNTERGSNECQSSDCNGNGCALCTPRMTIIVCQTQHNIRIVPDEGDNTNVPSGTCVDHTIITDPKIRKDVIKDEPKLQVYENAVGSSKGYDFLLTAQGGLKGTSKPVYYRVLLNENFTPQVGTSLTCDVLQKITYHMSFQYGTATKAVRSVPVVYYSSRLAAMGMGYINYLRGRRGSSSELVKAVTIDDEGLRRRTQRDGTEIPHQKYMRTDLVESSNMKSFLKTELLLQSKAFREQSGEASYTHLSA